MPKAQTDDPNTDRATNNHDYSIGQFPRSRQKCFILVVIDYFTTWVKAESFARIQATDVKNFIWKFIIYRNGLPYEIIADNGSQFISDEFEEF